MSRGAGGIKVIELHWNMKVNNSLLRRYGVAVVSVMLTLLLKLLLEPLICTESPFLLFFAAVMVGT